MPTERPRLTITLTPEIGRALDAFCGTMGVSRSAFIVDMLQASLPQLEMIALASQQLKRAGPDVQAAARERLSSLVQVAQSAYDSVGAAGDLFASTITPASVRRPEAGARRVGESLSPPLSNRGGRSPGKGGKVVPLKPRGGSGRAR